MTHSTHKWDENDDQRLLELRDKGWRWKKIAESFGFSVESVRSRHRRLRGDKQRNRYWESQLSEPTIRVSAESENEMVVSAKDTLVHSVEELLRVAKVDTEVWRVSHYIVNQWQVHSNTEGKVPLYQVKAWLERRVPKSIFPVIQPVKVETRIKPLKTDKSKSTQRVLIVPDLHVGFWRETHTRAMIPLHSRQAMDLLLQVASTEKFDSVIYLGDVLDLAEWSDKFLRSPELTQTTQPAIIETHWWLLQIQLAAKAKGFMIEGNHEIRMDNQIIKHITAAYNLSAANTRLHPALSVPNLLAVEDIGIKWIDGYPDAHVWLNDTLKAEHGKVTSAIPGGTARSMIEKSDVSIIQGHVHRIEQVSKTIYTRRGSKDINATVAGCLIDIGGKVPARYQAQNWQQGFAIVEHDNEQAQITTIPINNGKAIYNGIYEARGEREISTMIDQDIGDVIK